MVKLVVGGKKEKLLVNLASTTCEYSTGALILVLKENRFSTARPAFQHRPGAGLTGAWMVR